MPPSDFSVLKNFSTKTHSWEVHAELAVKQLSGFHYQRNVAFKFIRIEPSGLAYYILRSEWVEFNAPLDTI